MRRVLSVWLQTFATDLLRRRLAARGSPHDGVVILTRAVASREIVAGRCASAARAGVREGMDLAHARSLLPAGARLRVEEHRPERDAAALEALARWALRFSPMVAVDGCDGLLIDATGTQRLHRGEARLVRALAAGIGRLGFGVRLASAGTFGCAWALARHGGHPASMVESGREREALSPLPVGALRVDDLTARGLGEIGITTVGQVLNLPRASLASRFEDTLLRRVRESLGEEQEPIEPVRPAPPLRAGIAFDGPTDRPESVEAAAREMLGELAAELARRERGVRRLDVELARPRAEPTRVRIDLSRPSRSERHLWSLLRSRLERVDLGEGVEGVALTATRTGRLRHEQTGSDVLGAPDERASGAAWGELTDTLVSRLGADRVLRMESVESHLPERAVRERSVMEAERLHGPDTCPTGDRPTVLFSRPEAMSAMALTPDGPVMTLSWRGMRLGVLACAGPERIGQEWWRWDPPQEVKTRRRLRQAPPERDYFRVQVESGRWLWVFRHVGTGRWFVHGEWC